MTDMTDTEFEKLIVYLDQRFDKAREETVETVRASENRLNDRFDAVMAAIDNVATDQVAEQSQLNRHEDWIVKADKSLTLGYEA